MKALLRIAGASLLLLIAVVCAIYWNPLWFADEQTRIHLGRSNVRSQILHTNGHRLHYLEASPADGSPGIPLVLIHGLGSRAEDWSPLIPSLASAGFHVYALDLLGYGRSDKPDVSYSIALEESVVLDFLSALHLQHTDLAGWSMGGWIAARVALDHPALVDRLVLYDSAGIAFQPSYPPTTFVPTDVPSLNRLISLLTPNPPAIPAFTARAVLRRIHAGGWIVQRSVDAMVSGADLLDSQLPSLTQPTLIVWGSEDRLIPIAVGEAMHRAIPHSDFQPIPGCGHLAPAECAQPVLRATIDFLTAHAPPPESEPPVTADQPATLDSPPHP